MEADEVLEMIVRAAREGRVIVGPHAEDRMIVDGLEPRLLDEGLREDTPEIVENYRTDSRGPSCLIRAEVAGEVIHVVVTGRQPVFVITCYRPNLGVWYPDFRTRR